MTISETAAITFRLLGVGFPAHIAHDVGGAGFGQAEAFPELGE
jgi:hypothetical protein